MHNKKRTRWQRDKKVEEQEDTWNLGRFLAHHIQWSVLYMVAHCFFSMWRLKWVPGELQANQALGPCLHYPEEIPGMWISHSVSRVPSAQHSSTVSGCGAGVRSRPRLIQGSISGSWQHGWGRKRRNEHPAMLGTCPPISPITIQKHLFQSSAVTY